MKKITFFLCALLLSWSIGYAQDGNSFQSSNSSGSTITNGPAGSTTQNMSWASSQAPVVITHSNSQDIELGQGITCNTGNIANDNSFFRDFDLANDFGITVDLTVTAAEVGIEQVTNTFPLVANIWSSDAPFPNGNLTLLGTGTYEAVPADAETVVSIPVDAVVPAGSIMVLEISITGDGSTTFFVGANLQGQTGASWIQSEPCGALVPSDLVDFGFDNSYVMNVIGDTNDELNDDPETAATLTVGEVFEDNPVIADNTEATATAIDDPSCGNFTEADLWYSVVVPESGSVSVESREDDGSITDTAISLYEGEIGALVEVVCNDDGGAGLFSLTEVEGRTPGEVLYARVWEWNGGSLGTFQMSAYYTPPPVNDDPIGAIPLTVGSVFTDFPVTATNVSATDTAIDDPSCGNYGGADVWFTVVVPSTGQLAIEADTADGITDTGMSVYSGEIGSLVEIGCDDDDGNGLFSLVDLMDQEGGSTLYVRVWEWGGGGFGPFQIAAYSDCAVNGGEIALPNGNTEAEICLEGGAEAVNPTLGGMVTGTNTQWVITDTAGVILDLPAPPPFDLTGLGTGTFLLWHLSFEDGLTGAAIGESAGNLMGCFDLSNPITVNLVEEGGVCEVCEYTLEMNDSFGDGWNGAIMDVLVDGVVVLNDVGLDTDPNNNGAQGFLTFPVFSTAEVTTVFVDGGGFPEEVSYRIINVDGQEVATGNADTNVEPGAVEADCPSCVSPQNLVANNFAPGTVDLSWDGFEGALGYIWEIQNVGVAQGTPDPIDAGSTIEMTSDSAVGNFIDGNTYTFYVQSFCTEDDSSVYSSIDFLFFFPPSNDDCENAIELVCGETITGATTNASDSGANPAGDVFYTYTGNGSEEVVQISLCDGGTDYDSLLRVYDDECALINEIAVNDDFCGLQSQVGFTSDGTTTYTIMVEGFSSSAGNFSLETTCTTLAPPGECDYTLEMFDSFGDGWNGALVNVLRNGAPILFNVGLDDDPSSDGSTGSLPFDILPGDDITTELVDGGAFPEEISYNILDVNGAIVASGDATTNVESGSVSGDCTILSVESPALTTFNFYPNPAQNRINLDAQQSIERVTIVNMFGQKVLDQKVGVANTSLDVSNLSTGNYFMQVTIDGQTGVYKVLKQ